MDQIKSNILIIEDHPAYSHGLQKHLKSIFPNINFNVASNGFQALEANRQTNYNILIVDMCLPDMTGIELIQHIKNKHYNSKIITNSYDYIMYDLLQLQKLNVDSILLKEESLEIWKDVIKFNLENKKYYSKTVSERLERQKTISEIHTLTEAELEILKLLCKGYSTDKIAEQRNVSVNTINSQKKKIFLKFEVHNAVELAVIALKKGFI